jgi:hypothetical protein
MAYITKEDKMANIYISIQSENMKWTKTIFYLLDLTMLNIFIILSPCSSKIDCGNQNLLEMSAREPHVQSTPSGRPYPQAKLHTMKADTEDWPDAALCLQFHVCTPKHKEIPNSSGQSAKSACGLEFTVYR